MTEQDFEKYLTERFHDQRTWLDEKSIKYKRWHQSMMVATIVLAGSAPVVTALVPITTVPVVLSGVVSIVASLHQASRFKELWTTYRAAAEALQREWHLFVASVHDYGGVVPERKRSLFVERVEAFFSRSMRCGSVIRSVRAMTSQGHLRRQPHRCL